MIQPEQLSAALRRLDPRDREVLDLSLRRRVPDDALARLYDSDAGDVARRRAAAIERLADDLGVEKGEDLGSVLKALLEPGTWEGAGEPAAPAPPPGREPVLEMLGSEERKKRGGRRALAIVAGSLAGLALLGGAGYLGATELGDRGSGSGGDGENAPRRFVPQAGGPLAAPFPSDPASAKAAYATAYLPGRATLYGQPGGKPAIRIPGRTEWGSPRVLGVVRQSGRWLAVQAPELENGSIGWLREEGARVDAVTYSLHVELRKRRLVVRRDGKEVRRMRIAVGSKKHPTPTGRFSVTDKLSVTDKGSPYGCCVLALTGHQTNLPRDWPGGDRLAIHATTDTQSIGKPVSLGCMRLTERQGKWLIETIPLGAPVFIAR
jgi:hypothetical protein